MMASKKVVRRKTRTTRASRMTADDAVFAELEAMSQQEQDEIIPRLLEWIDCRADDQE